MSKAKKEIVEVVEVSPLSKGDTPDFHWYVIHALSGYENRVKKTLTERIVRHNMTEYFSEILIPEEMIVKNVNGKKRNVKKKFFPGYVLVKMILKENTWRLVNDTDKVTGFIGGEKGKPAPISDEEAAKMLGQVKDGFKPSKKALDLDVGDSVKVLEGPFSTFVGVVEMVNEKGKIKVNVSIFGRPTPVELDYSQVEKV